MGKRDKRIDAYIEEAADFAKPILKHLREVVHRAFPEVVETWKWSFPHFTGRGIICSMAAFKEHCTFGFWRGDEIFKPEQVTKVNEAMGHLGRIKKLSDLPSDRVLLGYISKAVELDRNSKKRVPKKIRKPVEVPEVLFKALKQNKKAGSVFAGFSNSHRKEYVEWIVEAKRPETRERRLKEAIAMMTQGKSRHWNYQRRVA